MLELAKKNRYGSFWTVSRFISVLVFCCQQSHAATIYSLDSSIWAKASAPENVYRVPQTVQVKYSAGLMLLPEWDHESWGVHTDSSSKINQCKFGRYLTYSGKN